MRRALGAALVTAALLGASVATPAAHPSATTTVSIALGPADAVSIALGADADPLITKLEVFGNVASVATADTARARAGRLTTLSPILQAQIDLRADDAPIGLHVDSIDVSDSGQATIQLSGRMPAHSRGLTWASSLVYGSYPVAFHRSGHDDAVYWLEGHQRSDALQLAEGAGLGRSAVGRGVWLGFTHILPHGFDHILFVVGLFLLSTGARQVFMQVSAFTIAHSITLGLSLYGVLSLPSAVVEPLIAVSVAYVGVENLITNKLQPWRVVIVFGFGLLHGLGFAEALANLHLQRSDMLSMLVSFNAGVELGQLSVIAVAALTLRAAVSLRAGWKRPLMQLASAAIGITGLVWTIERVI